MDVVIIGAGGHGRVVLDILQTAGTHHVAGFIDADASLAGSTIDGVSVLGQANLLPRLRQQKLRGAIVAIGDNKTRLSYARRLEEQGFELISAIHPTSVIARSARVGPHAVIASMAHIGAAAVVGDSVIVNTAAIVEHECVVAAGVHLCPAVALAGRVRIGERAFIGLGARIIQCVNIGEDCTVGAGAVVLRDVEAGCTVVGVPARIMREERAANHLNIGV